MKESFLAANAKLIRRNFGAAECFSLARAFFLVKFLAMKSFPHVPTNFHAAGAQLHLASLRPLNQLPHTEFLRAWGAIAYLFPGLHPDEFNSSECAWPKGLVGFAVEAWSRFENGVMSEDDLYQCDSQWAGIFDRLATHTDQEKIRRDSLRNFH